MAIKVFHKFTRYEKPSLPPFEALMTVILIWRQGFRQDLLTHDLL